jgi:hypothetical protein
MEHTKWITEYYGALLGGTITKVGHRRQNGDNESYPWFEVTKPTGEVYEVEVSRDEEGNGPGFLFGLPDPNDKPKKKKKAPAPSRQYHGLGSGNGRPMSKKSARLLITDVAAKLPDGPRKKFYLVGPMRVLDAGRHSGIELKKLSCRSLMELVEKWDLLTN